MKISRGAVRAARRLTGLAGYDLAPRAGSALARLADVGISAKTVIDVGAALGDWSRECAKSFPLAAYVLVEPLDEFGPSVQAAATDVGGVAVAAAAGRNSGTTTIHVHRDLVGSSLLREREGTSVDGTPRQVTLTTLDELVETLGLESPFLIKLDVQGAELDVLAGGGRALADTQALIVEVSFFSFYFDGSPFEEVIAIARAAGFVVFDIENLSRRPLDGALAQADVVFVREESPVRAQHVYASPEQRAAQDSEFSAAIRRRLERVERS
jgi:FkbM family methyltransferase